MRRKIFTLLALAFAVVAAGTLGVRDAASARRGVATVKAGWSQPQVIGSPADAAALAASEADSLGRVYAAWQRGSAIVLSTWQGGVWGAPQTVSPAGVSASGPTVAVDDSGRVLVAWSANGDVYATVVGSGAVANLSHSPTVTSDLPRAGFVSGLGFVVLWREMLVPGSQGCHFEEEDDASALTEAHLGAGGWSAPEVVYKPEPSESGYPTWICELATAATHDGTLVLPLITFNTYQVREYSRSIKWDGSAWSVGGEGGYGGVVNTVVGFPGGSTVFAWRGCVAGGCAFRTSTGVDLASSSAAEVLGGPVAATADETMLVAWTESGGLIARSSDDGLDWAAATALTTDAPVTAVAATGAGGGSFFVAYLTQAGELRSVHLGTPPVADFTLAVAPASRSVTAGGGASYSVTVTGSGGFGGAVSLSVAGVPAGASAQFSANPATSSSTLALSTTAATPAGSYPLTVTGTSGALTRTAQATLVVQAPPPGPAFELAASPAGRTVTAGDAASYTLTVSKSGGFAGTVSLSVGGLPAGAAGAFSPNPASSSSTLAVTTSASTPAGSYPLTVMGSSGALSRSAGVTLVVQAPTPPPPPPPASGGGGGGGGGAIPPELGVTGTASPQPQKVGDTFLYTFTIVNSSLQQSTVSWLNVTLPAGVQLSGYKVNRGPGCATQGQNVSCNLDFFPAKYTDTVLLFATVTATGDLTTTAHVVSQPGDSNTANDTATLALQLAPATPPSTPPAVPPTAKKLVQPSIRIVSTTPTKTRTVVVRVAIRNWPIFKSRQKSTPTKGGYWLIWVDGKLNAVSRLPGSGSTGKLKPGKHSIWVELVKDNTSRLTPRTRSTTVTVRVG